jgi:hypothetical protein
MGIETILATALAGSAVAGGAQALEARRARKRAEEEAAREREALAALQEEPAPIMPVPGDEKKMRRRSIAGLARRGRLSTILTGSTGDRLGA